MTTNHTPTHLHELSNESLSRKYDIAVQYSDTVTAEEILAEIQKRRNA